MEQWITDYYQDVDNLRLDEYVRRHTDDVVVKFGNNPPAVGKEQVRQAIGGFFQSIGGMRHRFINVYEEGDTAILELEIDYTRKDGGQVSVPAMSVLHRRGELVDQLRIYVDVAPVFAA
jgi:ketosteroid isomerase-like protein